MRTEQPTWESFLCLTENRQKYFECLTWNSDKKLQAINQLFIEVHWIALGQMTKLDSCLGVYLFNYFFASKAQNKNQYVVWMERIESFPLSAAFMLN